MANKLTFIYFDPKSDYYQRKIMLDKREIKVEDVYLALDSVKKFDRNTNLRKISKEMDRLILNHDVIMSGNGFTTGDAIVTTGGVIIGNLSTVILNAAARKRDDRIKKVDSYFIDKAYAKKRLESYLNNLGLIDELLELHKGFLTGEFNGTVEEHIELLRCLIEIVEPIKNSNYKGRVNRLLKEYSTN